MVRTSEESNEAALPMDVHACRRLLESECGDSNGRCVLSCVSSTYTLRFYVYSVCSDGVGVPFFCGAVLVRPRHRVRAPDRRESETAERPRAPQAARRARGAFSEFILGVGDQKLKRAFAYSSFISFTFVVSPPTPAPPSTPPRTCGPPPCKIYGFTLTLSILVLGLPFHIRAPQPHAPKSNRRRVESTAS
eukprot:scaffold78558_cov70-Phaeocystis_antarctica.AAC.1